MNRATLSPSDWRFFNLWVPSWNAQFNKGKTFSTEKRKRGWAEWIEKHMLGEHRA